MHKDAQRTEPVDESRLVAQAREGDLDAFGQLVENYKEKVYMIALQMTRHHADADEVSQQAFVRAFQSISSFQGTSAFYTWIYRITVNCSLSHLKQKNRWTPLPDGDSDEPSAPDIGYSENQGDSTEQDQERQRLWAALDRLSPDIRAAVVLVYLQDMSPREAAQTVGCAEATMHWRLFKARKLLQRYLA